MYNVACCILMLIAYLHRCLNENEIGIFFRRICTVSRIKKHPSRETAKFITGGSLLCLRIPPPPRRFCNKNGFSLVELIVVILIIAILAVAVFAGGSAAIKKAHIAKATSDLHNFQIAVEMTLNESPQVANIAAPTKKAQLEGIMDALNDNLAADYKLTAVDGTLTGNITKDVPTTEDTNYIICQSDKTDAWGNPYFVIIDRAERGGSSASEFYMTAVTAGPNAILHLDGAIDVDDVFSLTSYADGDVISATYNMAEAAPTIVGGSEAATTYTSAMTAPVNNGVTVGGYVAPETPAQDPQQGGGNNEQAQVVDLTGTVWDLKDNFTVVPCTGSTTFSIITENHLEGSEALIVKPDEYNNTLANLVFSSTALSRTAVSNDVHSDMRRFKIIGGEDVTNPAFAAWLQENATQQEACVVTISLTNPIHTEGYLSAHAETTNYYPYITGNDLANTRYDFAGPTDSIEVTVYPNEQIYVELTGTCVAAGTVVCSEGVTVSSNLGYYYIFTVTKPGVATITLDGVDYDD